MAWKETCVIEQREEFIADWLKKEWNVRELCRRYGIAPKTGYKWMKRFAEEGKQGLRDQRRARREQGHRIAQEIVERVVELRLAKPHWGPKKLKSCLRERDKTTIWPCETTIGEILKRHNLVKARKRRERGHPSSAPLGHVKEVNQVWCTDLKGWYRCGDGEPCYPLTISDAQSRYLLCLEALPKTGHPWLRPHYEEAFRTYGMPEAMRHDNGPPFITRALGGLGEQAVWLLELWIRIERIRPGKPQDNGRLERLHGTIQRELAVEPAANWRKEQVRMDRFRLEYNEERPHESLGMKTPASCYEPSARPYTGKRLEANYEDCERVRKVKQRGMVRWKNRDVYLNHNLEGRWIGLEEIGEGWQLVWFHDYPVALLDTRLGQFREIPKMMRAAEGSPHGGSPLPPSMEPNLSD